MRLTSNSGTYNVTEPTYNGAEPLMGLNFQTSNRTTELLIPEPLMGLNLKWDWTSD
jgi:hypothetical protein